MADWRRADSEPKLGRALDAADELVSTLAGMSCGDLKRCRAALGLAKRIAVRMEELIAAEEAAEAAKGKTP